jgi:hypothetical protein
MEEAGTSKSDEAEGWGHNMHVVDDRTRTDQGSCSFVACLCYVDRLSQLFWQRWKTGVRPLQDRLEKGPILYMQTLEEQGRPMLCVINIACTIAGSARAKIPST